MRKLAILILFFISATLVFSQQEEITVDKNYNSQSFTEFAKDIELTKNIRFFFASQWVDSILIIQNTTPSSLNKILSESFQRSNLSFHIEGNTVIITNNYKISETLPSWMGGSGDKKTIAEIDESSFMNFGKSKEDDENFFKNGSAVIGDPSKRNLAGNVDIAGQIREEETGEPIIGAVVFFQGIDKGTVTDNNGYFLINVPRGQYDVLFKYVGRKDRNMKVTVNDGGTLNLNLEEQIVQLRDVVITADKEHNVRGLEVGLMKLDIKTVKQIPTSLGEPDIIKTAILLPGVQTVGEGASGFNVRGGSTDQNLILIDGSPIYNSSHLFGFFSVFNSDVIKDFRLYKSGVPANYGGRISSVFDVSIKNGNRKKYSVSGGISPITGKLTVEGPIIKDKVSFVVSGRSTYSDWILKQLNDPQLKNSNAYFWDLNAKVSAEINSKNTLNISGYHSRDNFSLNSDTTYNYQNSNASVSWKHSFSKKLYSTVTGIYSNYMYEMNSYKNPYSAFNQSFSINHKEAKLDFAYFPHHKHKLTFGGNSIFYSLNPGIKEPGSTDSEVLYKKIDREQAVESAFYVNDEYRITGSLSLNLGVRYSMYHKLGPGTVYDYRTDATREIGNRIDSTTYGSNKVMSQFGGPEFRFSARYQLGLVNSVKVSYNKMYQYIHMMTNTTAVSPVDIWKLSDNYIPPQMGNQFALGYYHNFKDNTIEASIELYYKDIDNLIEYKGGAELQMNDALETDVLSGQGRAYGAELLIKKKYGRLNGWIGYTFSRSLIKVSGEFSKETINQGEFFPTNYDKPHDLTIVSNYKFSRRFSITNNFTYSTGRPITYPVAKYRYDRRELLHFSNRNEYRVPDYFRWDLSINIDGNLKSEKVADSMWSFSIYNLTGRKNVYSIYFKSEGGQIQGYKLSIFAQPIFTVTYNFKF